MRMDEKGEGNKRGDDRRERRIESHFESPCGVGYKIRDDIKEMIKRRKTNYDWLKKIEPKEVIEE